MFSRPEMIDLDRPHTGRPESYALLVDRIAQQRDGLCRGLAFVVILTLSCLLIAYAPLLCGDPDWAAAGVMSTHAAMHPSFAGRVRTMPPR